MSEAESSQSSPHSTPREGDPAADRRAKLNRLRDELKIDPFGQRVDGLITLAEAVAKYDAAADEAHKADAAHDKRPVVKVAGRVMLHRVMGNLIFMTLRDHSGDLQVAVSKKAVDPQSFQLAKLTDLSDIVVCEGPLAKTKTGEITVWARSPESRVLSPESGIPAAGSRTEDAASLTQDSGLRTQDSALTTQDSAFQIATKSLAPPPGKWHGLQDPELRYRQRYVDLWANPQVMKTMQLRIRIVEEIRQFLRRRGFMEVETPMMQSLAGGAAARPFVTHHNALDIPLFLRIAPELFLKRLLVGGFSKVFEINRNFRNEGISPRHNPEFTMLEAYEAFGSWETMADLVEEMICTVAQNVLGTLVIEHKDAEGKLTKTINLTRPWRRVRMADLVEERTGWKFDRQAACGEVLSRLTGMLASKQLGLDPRAPVPAESQQRWAAAAQGLAEHLAKITPAEQLTEVYEKLIEPTLVDPCYVTHVPSVVIPLARENKADPFFADVYELAINGQEISPGYSELNDPDVQERHFRHQVGDKEEQQKVDEDFLNALRVGMPPAGGMGLGIDRLVMMLTGAESIRDVILFPLMKPSKD